VTPSSAPRPWENRDAATLALLRARDQVGLRHLLEDHGGVVLARLRRIFRGTLCEDDLEEALCRTLARIWQTAFGHDPALGTMRAWLFVVTRNNALCIVRERRTELSLDAFLDVLTALDTNQSQQERLRRIADLYECLKLLPRHQRVVLQADLDADGTAPTAELAARLGVSHDAVCQARRRGRDEVKVMMRRLGHFSGPEAPPADGCRPESSQ
jgi:RNA polymerase sigma factor (sigma-70 family)